VLKAYQMKQSLKIFQTKKNDYLHSSTSLLSFLSLALRSVQSFFLLLVAYAFQKKIYYFLFQYLYAYHQHFNAIHLHLCAPQDSLYIGYIKFEKYVTIIVLHFAVYKVSNNNSGGNACYYLKLSLTNDPFYTA
jgi:hypothetical protein